MVLASKFGLMPFIWSAVCLGTVNAIGNGSSFPLSGLDETARGLPNESSCYEEQYGKLTELKLECDGISNKVREYSLLISRSALYAPPLSADQCSALAGLADDLMKLVSESDSHASKIAQTTKLAHGDLTAAGLSLCVGMTLTGLCGVAAPICATSGAIATVFNVAAFVKAAKSSDSGTTLGRGHEARSRGVRVLASRAETLRARACGSRVQPAITDLSAAAWQPEAIAASPASSSLQVDPWAAELHLSVCGSCLLTLLVVLAALGMRRKHGLLTNALESPDARVAFLEPSWQEVL